MLKELKFVQGAVAKKDFIPAMTHFRIEKGTVRSYNGRMALSSPINLDLECCPKAEAMVKAIGQCNESVTITMTPGNRLAIRSGNFRSFVETVDGETPHVTPDGKLIDFNGSGFLEACKVLYDFIGNDASRPWTNGILLKDQSAFATNNVCLVEYWLGVSMPFVLNIPRMAIKEVIRIDEAPTHAQLEGSSITLHYMDGRWIRTQLLETTWPDLTQILDQPSNPQPVPEGFFEGLETLKATSDGSSRVYIKNGAMRTHLEEYTGAEYEIALPFEGCYQINMLSLLNGVVDRIDMTLYPGPCLFYGEKVRGAIIGMRM